METARARDGSSGPTQTGLPRDPGKTLAAMMASPPTALTPPSSRRWSGGVGEQWSSRSRRGRPFGSESRRGSSPHSPWVHPVSRPSIAPASSEDGAGPRGPFRAPCPLVARTLALATHPGVPVRRLWRRVLGRVRGLAAPSRRHPVRPPGPRGSALLSPCPLSPPGATGPSPVTTLCSRAARGAPKGRTKKGI